MAIIISPPLMRFSSQPYPNPNSRAKGVAISTLRKKDMGPLTPSSMDMVPPSSPATMPRGKPKFSPHPECTMGTMASTSTAFQLKRLMVLVICMGRSAFTKGARMNKRSRNPAMISRGRPKLCSAPAARSLKVDSFLFTVSLMLCSSLYLADHQHAEILGGIGRR